METPSSEGRVHGLPVVPGSPEGGGGLEVVPAAGGGGPLHRGQVHQGGGSNLEMVPAGQVKAYAPTTSTVVEEVNPFWSDKVEDEVALRTVRPSFLPVEGGDELVSPLRGAGSDGKGRPESICRKMLQMMILENQRLRQEREMLRGHGEGLQGQQASVKDLVSLFEGESKTSESSVTDTAISWMRNRQRGRLSGSPWITLCPKSSTGVHLKHGGLCYSNFVQWIWSTRGRRRVSSWSDGGGDRGDDGWWRGKRFK